MIGGSGGMFWPVAMEAWGKGREVRVRANEKKREWGESRDKEKEKIIKILNTHVTVTVHICTVIVAILYLYTSLHPLMWVIFCSNCVKLVTFFILHIYAQADEDALKVHLHLLNSRTVGGEQQDASDEMQMVWSFGLSLDMAKRAGRVGFGSGQSGCGSNGSRVKKGSF